MDNVIIPCTTDLLRRVKSPKIVEDFLTSKAVKGKVQVEKTGRNFDRVYAALHMYLKSHPELGVDLAREDGDIILYRRAIGADSTVSG